MISVRLMFSSFMVLLKYFSVIVSASGKVQTLMNFIDQYLTSCNFHFVHPVLWRCEATTVQLRLCHFSDYRIIGFVLRRKSFSSDASCGVRFDNISVIFWEKPLLSHLKIINIFNSSKWFDTSFRHVEKCKNIFMFLRCVLLCLHWHQRWQND